MEKTDDDMSFDFREDMLTYDIFKNKSYLSLTLRISKGKETNITKGMIEYNFDITKLTKYLTIFLRII